MKSVNSLRGRRPRIGRRTAATLGPLLALAAAALAGCGPDRPVDYQSVRRDNGYPSDVTTPPTVAKNMESGSSANSSSPLANSQDPLVQAAGDPLARGSDTAGKSSNFDAGSSSYDTTAPETDPLTKQNVGGATDHSHWLGGAVDKAHLLVSINGIQVADITGRVGIDITRHCVKGVNQAKFVYLPYSQGAYAQMNVIEGERDSSHPPLASFTVPKETAYEIAQHDAAAPGTSDSANKDLPKSVTRAVTFIAD